MNNLFSALLFTMQVKIYAAINLHSVHFTTYTIVIEQSSRFRFYFYKNYIFTKTTFQSAF
jgi:hypothetical protein